MFCWAAFQASGEAALRVDAFRDGLISHFYLGHRMGNQLNERVAEHKQDDIARATASIARLALPSCKCWGAGITRASAAPTRSSCRVCLLSAATARTNNGDLPPGSPADSASEVCKAVPSTPPRREREARARPEGNSRRLR